MRSRLYVCVRSYVCACTYVLCAPARACCGPAVGSCGTWPRATPARLRTGTRRAAATASATAPAACATAAARASRGLTAARCGGARVGACVAVVWTVWSGVAPGEGGCTACVLLKVEADDTNSCVFARACALYASRQPPTPPPPSSPQPITCGPHSSGYAVCSVRAAAILFCFLSLPPSLYLGCNAAYR
jgi:hypothetical protein